jgi:hypothetical protein
MIEFQPVTLEDREIVRPYLYANPYGNCDFSLANVFIWRNTYQVCYAVVDGFLVLSPPCDRANPYYMMPLGEGDLGAVLRKLIGNARERGGPFRMRSVTAEMAEAMDRARPIPSGSSEPHWSDYIYL